MMHFLRVLGNSPETSWTCILLLMIHFVQQVSSSPLNPKATFVIGRNGKKYYSVVRRTTTAPPATTAAPPPSTTAITTTTVATSWTLKNVKLMRTVGLNDTKLLGGAKDRVTRNVESSTRSVLKTTTRTNAEAPSESTSPRSYAIGRGVLRQRSESYSTTKKTLKKSIDKTSSWIKMYGGSSESIEVLVRRKSKKDKGGQLKQKPECEKFMEMLRQRLTTTTRPTLTSSDKIGNNGNEDTTTTIVEPTNRILQIKKTTEPSRVLATTTSPRSTTTDGKPGMAKVVKKTDDVEDSYVTDEDKMLTHVKKVTRTEVEEVSIGRDIESKRLTVRKKMTNKNKTLTRIAPKAFARNKDKNLPKNSMSRFKLTQVLNPGAIGKLRNVENFEKGLLLQEPGGHRRRLSPIAQSIVERPPAGVMKAESVEEVVIKSALIKGAGKMERKQRLKSLKKDEEGLGRLVAGPSGVGKQKTPNSIMTDGDKRSPFGYQPWDPVEVSNDWRTKTKLAVGLPRFSHDFFHDPINHTELKVKAGVKVSYDRFSHLPEDDVALFFGKSATLKNRSRKLPIAEAIEVHDDHPIQRNEITTRRTQKDRSLNSDDLIISNTEPNSRTAEEIVEPGKRGSSPSELELEIKSSWDSARSQESTPAFSGTNSSGTNETAYQESGTLELTDLFEVESVPVSALSKLPSVQKMNM